jgi:hypothetical protein
LVAAFLAIVVVTFGWIVNLRMGPRLEGFTGGPMALFVPLALLLLTAGWLILRGVLHGRVHWGVLGVLVVTAVATLVIVAVTCGPVACFVPGTSNRLAGWFLVLGVPLVALVHHLVLVSFPLEAERG